MVRILEISRVPLFKDALPQETTWFGLGAALSAGGERHVPERFGAGSVWRLVRELRAGHYDLVILPAVDIAYGHDPHWFKWLVRRLVQVAASTRLAAWTLEKVFRWRRQVVIFEDLSDSPVLSDEICALVPGFLAYFKREYDPDRTLRQGPRWEGINRRVLPWSLFLPTTEAAADPTEKTHDVFFSGAPNGAARREGLPRLRQLAARGYRIDVPDGRLGYREFMQRMAAAWLVWSPAGYGWDCYRHYEAAFAGSVPVINTPPSPRPLPYESETECFYYRAEGDGLEQVITRALADKERLRAMAARARARVLAEHTRQALVAKMQAAIVARLRLEGRASALLEEWT